MTPKVLARIIELTSELEQLVGGQSTFLFGENGDEVIGVLVSDLETTNVIMGDGNSRDDLN